MWTRTGRIERAGPPPGGPVRSIRKNNVLPGSGPTDLHYGKNGYVQTKFTLQSSEFLLTKENFFSYDVHQGPLSVDLDDSR